MDTKLTKSQLPATMPNISPEGNLARYLDDIRRFPMLSAEEEYTLAKDWRDHGNIEAAHKLVTSHLRLVAKIAMGYRGYGLPMGELIAEGNLGMMHAVKRFEPEKGFRLSTYAMWWIKASIQEYILRSWSLVKIGTTAAQKKLFFNLRRIKGQIRAVEDGDLSAEQVERIADELNVPEDEVVSMNRRMAGGDHSLNAAVSSDGESMEWMDWLVDDRETHDVAFEEAEEYDARRKLLVEAMKDLNEREIAIIQARRLSDTPETLENLSQRFGISRERVRQIESRAFEKLQLAVRNRASEQKLIG
ncbi:RNA polymerase sigma factor RpoH [Alphaproteobacteria bacterium LSUCC0684]